MMSEQEQRQQVLDGVREILDNHGAGFRNLISILQEVQDRFGYLPKPALLAVADHLHLSPVNVYGVATFYNQFRFNPPGKCHVRVCLGTACHIKGGDLIMDHWKRRLKIEENQRTEDGEYSLERVGCVGCCVMAPVSVVADEVIGHISPTRVDGILLGHKIKKEQAQREEQKQTEERDGKEGGS